MWWSHFVALALISLIFCIWMWLVHLSHINTHDVITTNVEVSLIEGDVHHANNSSEKIVRAIRRQFDVPELRKRQHHVVPKYMLDLYEQARQGEPSASGRSVPEVVRGLTPRNTASVLEHDSNLVVPNGDRRHLLVFDVPGSSYGETLESAELRLLLTAEHQLNQSSDMDTGVERLVHVYLLDSYSRARLLELDMRHVFQRQGDTWLSFDVTRAVRNLETRALLRMEVHIHATTPHGQLDLAPAVHPLGAKDVQPLLLLSYSAVTTPTKHGARKKRDAEDYEEESNNVWDDDRAPAQTRRSRKPRNNCRRKPLYVDFSEIHYDSWIVAPNGYEAFQCIGRCFFPVSEHLSPTKHAIVQTLLHSVSPGKAPRACCVPTRLEPISVLYIDQKGVLTYRFSYQDMVVAECGCR